MNKHMGDFTHHCDPEDNECWAKQFKGIIGCEKEDLNCWKKRLPELPCQLDDIKCWKAQIPDLPCEYHDFECMEHKLPPLPCRVLDPICWTRHVFNRNDDGSKKTDQGIEPNAQKRPMNWQFFVSSDTAKK